MQRASDYSPVGGGVVAHRVARPVTATNAAPLLLLCKKFFILLVEVRSSHFAGASPTVHGLGRCRDRGEHMLRDVCVVGITSRLP